MKLDIMIMTVLGFVFGACVGIIIMGMVAGASCDECWLNKKENEKC